MSSASGCLTGSSEWSGRGADTIGSWPAWSGVRLTGGTSCTRGPSVRPGPSRPLVRSAWPEFGRCRTRSHPTPIASWPRSISASVSPSPGAIRMSSTNGVSPRSFASTGRPTCSWCPRRWSPTPSSPPGYPRGASGGTSTAATWTRSSPTRVRAPGVVRSQPSSSGGVSLARACTTRCRPGDGAGVGRRGARFLVCGRFVPGYRELLAPLLDQPGVEVLGFRDDVPRLLRNADVLILPSVEEGSAAVTYEAQASGCVLLVVPVGSPVRRRAARPAP